MTDEVAMRLRPSARLQKYLGRELISDPNLAVLEFVKNAYDAGAEEVFVEFSLTETPTSLRVSDDGTGMDETAFRENWLRPGFSEKSPDYTGTRQAPAGSRQRAVERMMRREPAGEKGLGRLSAGRLGETLEVWTRTRDDEAWLHVTFDWATFDDMSVAMEDIPIPFEFVRDPPFRPKFRTGTVIDIHGLRQKWLGRIPGRPHPGRRKTRLGRLHQDLQFLLRGLPAGNDRIALSLDSDSIDDKADIGTITPLSAQDETAAYVYSFDVSVDNAGYPTVSRFLSRSESASNESGAPREESLPDLTVTARVARDEGRPAELRSGSFSGRFLYTPPPATKRALEVDSAASGVLVYRDNVLVEPYGLPGDDWLGVEARKASRQGHAAIQPNTFSGYVQISRRSNPELGDMSNRLGLLDNEASEDFVGHAQAEFRNFESLLYAEVLEPRWRSKGQQATEAAARSERLSQLRLRALAHKAGQPLQALAFETVTLEDVAKQSDLPEGVAEKLRGIAERVQHHVERISLVVREVADLRPPEFEEVPVADLLSDVCGECLPVAAHKNVRLVLQTVSRGHVIIPRSLVASALHELIVNAIEAPRDHPQGQVTVHTEETSSSFDVIIVDDGTGIAGWTPHKLLSEVLATKARPGGGLAGAESEIDASNGELQVASGPTGTTIRVRLPLGVSPVARPRKREETP